MNSRPHYLERIRYWQGQRLRHTDLQSQLENSEQLRWWHNRVHDAYGIGEGLTVTLNDDAAQVTIAQGVAYDAFGRELFLFSEKTANFPEPTGMAQYLIASFQPPTGAEPLIYWKPAAWFQVHDGAVLARQTPTGELVSDGQKVRAMKRPYIGYGATAPGNTAWEVWNADYLPSASCAEIKPQKIIIKEGYEIQGVKLHIDTSEASFEYAPRYFATVQGNSLFEQQHSKKLAKFMACETIDEFSLYILFVKDTNDEDEAELSLISYLQDNQIWVSWIGIQPFPEEGAI